MTKQSGEIERNYPNPVNVYANNFSLSEQNRAFVTGALLTAVAFLEACINELFCDAYDHVNGRFKMERVSMLDPEIINLVADMWKLGIPQRAGYPISRSIKMT